MGEQSNIKITIKQILAYISPGFPTVRDHVWCEGHEVPPKDCSEQCLGTVRGLRCRAAVPTLIYSLCGHGPLLLGADEAHRVATDTQLNTYRY